MADVTTEAAMNGSPASSFTCDLIRKLQSRQKSAAEAELPSYNVADASDVDLLVSSSTPVHFQLGTGADIYTTTLIPAILTAKQEVILVTCFWAKSKTLSALGKALWSLAIDRRLDIERGHDVEPLSFHICFSSRSILQKLFHTTSREGYVYPPESWEKVLGLPSAEALRAGRIEMRVKTLFFLPFSVMHPKFLIVDRQRAFVPSCNVSWEAWFEGCVEIQGQAVGGLVDFFRRTWRKDLGELSASRRLVASSPPVPEPVLSTVHHMERFSSHPSPVPTMILPSSHHRTPDFRPFPWQSAPPPPPTPLNVAMLELIDSSVHSIYMQTPNLTCKPVISALLDALGRGVNVTIVTSRNMMLLEQLVTAGTTTSWCIRFFVRRYKAMTSKVPTSTSRSTLEPNLEAQHPHLGQLHISYFHRRRDGKSAIFQSGSGTHVALEEPVRSHLKLTVVDREYTVLGSGNMDRASWYTSQELGILFQSRDFAASMDAVAGALDGRLDTVFQSS